MPRLTLPLALALPLALGGCGGGSNDSTSAPAGDVGNYAPYAVGNRWLYESSDEALPGSLTGALTEVSAATLTDGRDALLLRTDSLTSLLTISQSYLQERPDALYQLFDGMMRILPGVDELRLLRLPLRAGDSYTAYRYDNIATGADLDGDGISESRSHRLDIEVVGIESVTVPAGTFADALKVVATRTSSSNYSQGFTSTSVIETTSWYVAGVGTVQSRTANELDGVPGGVTHMNLLSYRIDGVRSEEVAPTVQSVSPAPGSTDSAGFGINISATFSEYLDPATVNATTLTVQDGDGNTVAGSAYYSGRTVRFAPGYILPAGNYTVTLATGPADGSAMRSPRRIAGASRRPRAAAARAHRCSASRSAPAQTARRVEHPQGFPPQRCRNVTNRCVTPAA